MSSESLPYQPNRHTMNRTAAIIITILVLALIGLGVVAFVPLSTSMNSNQSPGAPATGGPTTSNTYNTTYTSTTTVLQATPVAPAPTPSPTNHVVTYLNGSFSPQVTYVHPGDSVTFVNASTNGAGMWVQGNPYNSAVPGFDEAGSIGTGSSWSYTFATDGIFTYRDHINTSAAGAIIVQ